LKPSLVGTPELYTTSQTTTVFSQSCCSYSTLQLHTVC